MTTIVRAILALFGLAATLAWSGCGGDDDGGGDPSGVELASYCTSFVEAICATALRCGCDAPDCEARAGARCPLRDGLALRTAIDDGSVPYNPVAAARFIERARTGPCDARPTDCGTTDACFALSAAGGPCGTNHGCAGGLTCVSGTCIAPRDDGAACAAPEECRSGRCSGSTCSAPVPTGSSCTADSECTTLRCDFATERCRDLEPVDGLCVEHGECTTGYCDRDSPIGAGACRARQPLGATCDEAPMCMDSGCLSSTCVPAACLDAV